ncbi:MAG: hypothetical protein QXW80_06845 [Candidatus Micrarchaeia archaeon]
MKEMVKEVDHISLLSLLSHSPLTLGEIVRLTQVNSEAKLNVILNKLVRRGFVTRNKNPLNVYEYNITLRGLLYLFYKILDKKLKEGDVYGTKS